MLSVAMAFTAVSTAVYASEETEHTGMLQESVSPETEEKTDDENAEGVQPGQASSEEDTDGENGETDVEKETEETNGNEEIEEITETEETESETTVILRG